MDCQERNFNRSLETLIQEGTNKINVTYVFVDALSNFSEISREIGEVHVSAIRVEGCNFISDFCIWNNNDKGWKLSTYGKGIVASEKSKAAVLESPWIFGNSIYQKTGLCLSFSYLLSTDSASSLSVILMTSSNSSIWKLSGYQGQTWQTGLVSFTTNEDFKVVIVAKGKLPSNVYHAAVGNISISSKQCERSPPHSAPGFTCEGNNNFQCENGLCVDQQLLCDGDNHCVDNSDEKNCKCLSNQFPCPTGECLAADMLCDFKKGCSDRADEARCEVSCPEDKFSCAGGGCVSWSLTCDRENNCEDGTDEPPICDSLLCPLQNLSCALSKFRRCVGNKGTLASY